MPDDLADDETRACRAEVVFVHADLVYNLQEKSVQSQQVLPLPWKNMDLKYARLPQIKPNCCTLLPDTVSGSNALHQAIYSPYAWLLMHICTATFMFWGSSMPSCCVADASHVR